MLNSSSDALNVFNKRPRHTNEDIVTQSTVLNNTPTISPPVPMVIADALKYKKAETPKIDALIDVQKLFYIFHYYKLEEKVNMNAATSSGKVRSEANKVIQFMMQQLPTLFDNKINMPNTSELDKATWLLKREQIKSTLSRRIRPNADSVEWSEYDYTLKFASKSLFDEMMRLFNLEKTPYRDQVGTLHAVYIRLCQHNSALELQKGTSNSSHISSMIIHNENEKENVDDAGSSILSYFFSKAKK
jgi:hypothetical protein